MADSAIFLQVLWPFKIFLSRHKISGVSFRSKEVKSYRRFFVEVLVAKIPIGRWRWCRSLKIHEVSLVKFASNNRQRIFWFRTVQQIFHTFESMSLYKSIKKLILRTMKYSRMVIWNYSMFHMIYYSFFLQTGKLFRILEKYYFKSDFIKLNITFICYLAWKNERNGKEYWYCILSKSLTPRVERHLSSKESDDDQGKQ